MRRLRRYLHIWAALTLNAFMVSFSTRLNAVLFLLGKTFRFVLFIIFVLILFAQTKRIGGYTVDQVLFFYMTFTVLDTVTQLFYREVYRFRPLVLSGDFDLRLVQPMNPLFRSLAGGADPLDLIMLVPYLTVLLYTVHQLRVPLSVWQVSLYILLLINGFMIATGFHILVLALAVLTTEITHAVMIYRDITGMGRIPVDIYRPPLRGILTFIIPVGVMMTFPAKALLGLLSWQLVVFSLAGTAAFLYVSLRVWEYSLRRYTSASS